MVRTLKIAALSLLVGVVAVWVLGLVAQAYAAAESPPLEPPPTGTTYYVSPSGNDSATGTTPATAWASVGKANGVTLKPGDAIRFAGGSTFAGSLRVRGSGGTAAAPVTFGSYGTGAATINAGADFGLYAYNAGGIVVDDLTFVGTPSTTACNGMQDGVRLEANTGGSQLPPVWVTRCDISGFYRYGVLVMSDAAGTGYTSTTITGNNAHGDGFAGLGTYAADGGRLPNVYVGDNIVHDNMGYANLVCSGSGICVAGVTNGSVIELNTAYNNGGTGKGGCGIWAYSSDHLMMQRNVSMHNRTSGADGDGFDFDDGTTLSTMQYNVSSDNDGAGLLFCQWHNVAGAMTGNVCRYNVSSGDGRKNGYGAVSVWGRVENLQVYNNTLYTLPATTPNSAFRLSNDTITTMYASNVAFVNNLAVMGGTTLATTCEPSMAKGSKGITFAGNLYHATGGVQPRFSWNGQTVAGLAAFRSATGQEGTAGVPTGSDADPGFTSMPLALPATMAAGADVTAVAAPARPPTGSPAATAGVAAAAGGLTPPAADLFAVPLPAASRFAGCAVVTTAPATAPATQAATPATATAAPPAIAGTTFGTAGSWVNAGNTIAKATDGNLSTFFDAPTGNGAVVGIDCGTPQVVGSILYAPRTGFAGRMVGGQFQAADDQAFTVNVVQVFTITTAPPVGSYSTAAVPATVGAKRFWRYAAPNNGYGNIAEIELVAPVAK